MSNPDELDLNLEKLHEAVKRAEEQELNAERLRKLVEDNSNDE